MKFIEGSITSPKGFKACGNNVGLKKDKKDMALIYSVVPASCAAAYTTNAVKAARDAFNALDQIGKDRVTNIARLTEAEELIILFENLGNVDETDDVTTSDALMVLQFVVKTREFSEWQAKIADVNGDGKVTAVDALLILQYATGKITSFPYNK